MGHQRFFSRGIGLLLVVAVLAGAVVPAVAHPAAPAPSVTRRVVISEALINRLVFVPAVLRPVVEDFVVDLKPGRVELIADLRLIPLNLKFIITPRLQNGVLTWGFRVQPVIAFRAATAMERQNLTATIQRVLRELRSFWTRVLRPYVRGRVTSLQITETQIIIVLTS